MNKIRFIVDSSSDFSPEELVSTGDFHIPLRIIFGDSEYLDGVDIKNQRFYEMLIESDALPTTSQGSIADFESEYEKVKKDGDKAIVITLSSKLSGTYQSACIAREGYEDIVTVVDSCQAAVGERILVEYGMRLRDEGAGFEEIADELTKRSGDICIIALLDTLE